MEEEIENFTKSILIDESFEKLILSIRTETKQLEFIDSQETRDSSFIKSFTEFVKRFLQTKNVLFNVNLDIEHIYLHYNFKKKKIDVDLLMKNTLLYFFESAQYRFLAFFIPELSFLDSVIKKFKRVVHKHSKLIIVITIILFRFEFLKKSIEEEIKDLHLIGEFFDYSDSKTLLNFVLHTKLLLCITFMQLETDEKIMFNSLISCFLTYIKWINPELLKKNFIDDLVSTHLLLETRNSFKFGDLLEKTSFEKNSFYLLKRIPDKIKIFNIKETTNKKICKDLGTQLCVAYSTKIKCHNKPSYRKTIENNVQEEILRYFNINDMSA